MFRVDAELAFTRQVTICTPIDGGHRDETCTATFALVPAEQHAALVDAGGASALLRRAVKRIDDIADAGGQPLTWSDAVRDAVLDLPHARVALLSAYQDAVSKVRPGN